MFGWMDSDCTENWLVSNVADVESIAFSKNKEIFDCDVDTFKCFLADMMHIALSAKNTPNTSGFCSGSYGVFPYLLRFFSDQFSDLDYGGI